MRNGGKTFAEKEIERLGVKNSPRPGVCDECGAELESTNGYVGETLLYCPEGHGIKWENGEEAVMKAI